MTKCYLRFILLNYPDISEQIVSFFTLFLNNHIATQYMTLWKQAKEIYNNLFLETSSGRNVQPITKLLYDPHAHITINCFRNSEGETILHAAIENNLPAEYIHKIILCKAHVNAQNFHRQTPLHCAVKCKRLSLAKNLLKYGAYINARDKDGNSVLHYTVLLKIEDFIPILLDGALTSIFKITPEFTPLHRAVFYNCKKEVETLLKSKKIIIDSKNIKGLTPHHLAAKVAKILIDLGASIDAQDENGATPLHWAQRAEVSLH